LFASGQFSATGSGPFPPDVSDSSTLLTGLFYGGGWKVFAAQAIGSAIITGATFGVTMVVMLAVNATGTLRVSKEGEMEGLDLHEHGISAYPEFVISALAAPGGMARDNVHGTGTT
jgi:Amt family ammonium transporter